MLFPSAVLYKFHLNQFPEFLHFKLKFQRVVSCCQITFSSSHTSLSIRINGIYNVYFQCCNYGACFWSKATDLAIKFYSSSYLSLDNGRTLSLCFKIKMSLLSWIKFPFILMTWSNYFDTLIIKYLFCIYPIKRKP